MHGSTSNELLITRKSDTVILDLLLIFWSDPDLSVTLPASSLHTFSSNEGGWGEGSLNRQAGEDDSVENVIWKTYANIKTPPKVLFICKRFQGILNCFLLFFFYIL